MAYGLYIDAEIARFNQPQQQQQQQSDPNKIEADSTQTPRSTQQNTSVDALTAHMQNVAVLNGQKPGSSTPTSTTNSANSTNTQTFTLPVRPKLRSERASTSIGGRTFTLPSRPKYRIEKKRHPKTITKSIAPAATQPQNLSYNPLIDAEPKFAILLRYGGRGLQSVKYSFAKKLAATYFPEKFITMVHSMRFHSIPSRIAKKNQICQLYNTEEYCLVSFESQEDLDDVLETFGPKTLSKLKICKYESRKETMESLQWVSLKNDVKIQLPNSKGLDNDPERSIVDTDIPYDEGCSSSFEGDGDVEMERYG